MSSYLYFRKGNIDLLEYSRSQIIYEVLGGANSAPFEKWSEVPKNVISYGIERLHEKKEETLKDIHKHEEMLKHLTDYEDLWETLNNIDELKEYIKEIETAEIELNMLSQIAESSFCDDEDTEKVPLMWMVD